jgi:2,4-dienoyl-CoA reductase-like NADH-dependent reductase (Old Yellow Enzyme family)
VSHLFHPLQLRDVTFENRCWVSPMCQYSATDGVVGAWHVAHLGALATGGAGLVMAEATGVTPEGRISVNCPGIWDEDQVAAWRPIVDFAHSQGARVGLQLAHAGRKGSTLAPWGDHLMASEEEGGWTAVAPSALAFEGYDVPHALSPLEIASVVQAFADGAVRAAAAGFDLVEIHAAHGYLAHQFLSPLSNRRVDQYGGSFENRVRFLCEVVEAVRGVIGSGVALFVRISASDYVQEGWDLDQSVRLARRLKGLGVDLIDVSSGGNVAGVRIPVGPGYQVHFAEAIRIGAKIATSAVGLITEPEQAEEIIASGQADAVMLARAFLRNPRWSLMAAERLGDFIPWPRQLERARTLRA